MSNDLCSFNLNAFDSNIFDLDIWSIIISYLRDPRDLMSLYNSNRWLFQNIMQKVVKYVYIDPIESIYIPDWVLSRLTNLRSIRCDIRVETLIELNNILKKCDSVEEICIRISTKKEYELLHIVSYLLCDEQLDKRYYRLEEYNFKRYATESIWIGKGKLSNSSISDRISLLILYRSKLKSLLTFNYHFSETTYIEILSLAYHLTDITYTDGGYHSCTSNQLYRMLTVNDNLKNLSYLPFGYDYETDRDTKFSNVDTFVLELHQNGQIYPNLLTLSIPISLTDISIIKNIFPNLLSIGFRYIHSVIAMGKQELNFNVSDLMYKQYNVTIYFYLSFDSIEIRQQLNRDIEAKSLISNQVCNILSERYPRAIIIDMENKLRPFILTKDNWLFNTTY